MKQSKPEPVYVPIIKPIHVEWKSTMILRPELISNRDKIYLFGDNVQEKGSGGMAGQMRGEINAIGIPTKKASSMDDSAFFSDDQFSYNVFYIFKAFLKIPKDRDIVVPSNIGRGLSQLDKKAPITYKYLTKLLSSLTDKKFNWTDDLINPDIALAIYTVHSMLINKKKPNLESYLPKIS